MAGDKSDSAPGARGDEPREPGAFCVTNGDAPTPRSGAVLYVDQSGNVQMHGQIVGFDYDTRTVPLDSVLANLQRAYEEHSRPAKPWARRSRRAMALGLFAIWGCGLVVAMLAGHALGAPGIPLAIVIGAATGIASCAWRGTL